MTGHLGCVYKITNIQNNKVYVGQTITTFKQRLQMHFSHYKRLEGKLTNKRLYKAMRKYGEEYFYPEKIISLDFQDSLNQMEREMIEFYDSYNNGYNMREY